MPAAKKTETPQVSATETWVHADGRQAVVQTPRDRTWAETHGFRPPAEGK